MCDVVPCYKEHTKSHEYIMGNIMNKVNGSQKHSGCGRKIISLLQYETSAPNYTLFVSFQEFSSALSDIQQATYSMLNIFIVLRNSGVVSDCLWNHTEIYSVFETYCSTF